MTAIAPEIISKTLQPQYWLEICNKISDPEAALENLRACWRLIRDARAQGMEPAAAIFAIEQQHTITVAARIFAQNEQLRWDQDAARREDLQEREAYRQKWARDTIASGLSNQGHQSANAPRSDWSRVRDLQRQLPNQAHAYYAVNLDGSLHFFRVDKPKEGRWAGKTFIKEQASDTLYPVRQSERLERILAAIVAATPQAAMLRYGREIGRCGHCHRTLTNEESRAYGIGPVCRENMGW